MTALYALKSSSLSFREEEVLLRMLLRLSPNLYEGTALYSTDLLRAFVASKLSMVVYERFG
jgi:hypothetical protein